MGGMEEDPTFQQELDKRLKRWLGMNGTRIFLTILAVVIGHLLLYLFFTMGKGKDYATQNLVPMLAAVIAVDLIGGISSYVYIAYHKLSEEIYNDHVRSISDLEKIVRELKDSLERDEIDANISIEEFPQDSAEQYLSLKITNNEDVDLLRCYGTLVTFERVSPDFEPNLEDKFNPNNMLLSWGGGGSTDGYITIHKNKPKTLNITKAGRDHAILLFHGPEPNIEVEGIYHVVIQIDGYFGDLSKHFKSVTYDGYFDYSAILPLPNGVLLQRILPYSKVILKFVKGKNNDQETD